MACPRCQGTGVCVDCQGSGKTDCPVCSGSGKKTTSRGTSFDCKSCQGTGQIECSTECSSCAGQGEITDELQKEVKDTYRPKMANMTPSSKVVGVLLGINVLVFLALQVDFDLAGQLCLFQFSPSENKWWAFLTPAFVHFSWWHLLANLYCLRSFGPILEGCLGKSRFLYTYLLAAITGCVGSWLALCYFGDHPVAGVGASGAIYGLFGAMAALNLRWGMLPYQLVRQVLSWAVGIVALGFALDQMNYSVLDNWGHIGGFVGGFVLTFPLPRPRGR